MSKIVDNSDKSLDFDESLEALACGLKWLSQHSRQCQPCIRKHLAVLHDLDCGKQFTLNEINDLLCPECSACMDREASATLSDIVKRLRAI